MRVRTFSGLLGLALCCVLGVALVGCGGDDKPKQLPHTGSGGGGGTGGGASGGTGGGTGGVPGAPTVKVTSPSAASDPSADTVVVGAQLTVLCTALASTLASATPVDAASVKIAVLDAEAEVVDEFPGAATQNENEYSASFVLTTIPTGPLSARCTAADTSTPPKVGSDTVTTFVDHGPAITVQTPAADSSYPQTGAVPFVFTVQPVPLAATDPASEVASVGLTVNGVQLTPTPDPSVTNGYKHAVNFNDTTLFPQPPSGKVPVVITATNGRAPVAAQSATSYTFTLDGTGPVITIKNPKNQDIIGGQVTLEFSVVDAQAGVDSKTVAVELNQAKHLYTPTVQWSKTGDDYKFTFDSANVTGSKVQLTVNVSASDLAGNPSTGASLVLYLDNQPPIVDLNPANVRVRKLSGTTQLCSESFDPLGTRAADDLESITPFKHFRALVWDQTNFVTGQTVVYYAATDPASVYLYLQPDGPTVPLLVNNDADPECDAINTVGDTLPFLQLKSITPAGTAWYKNTDGSVAPVVPPTPPTPSCQLGNEPEPPFLCSTQSDLRMVIRHNMTSVEPVVYGIGQMTGLECTGTGWEIASQLANATQKEGWFCLAASARDKVGNIGISPPIRVCYDDPGTSFVPACANSSVAAPSCTDGCTPPAGFPPTILALP